MKPYFELTYFPKGSKVVKKFEKKLASDERLKIEVRDILTRNNIIPNKVFILKEEEGIGKKGSWLEEFKYKKFRGKVRGIKKGLIKSKNWKNDFEIYLLYSKTRDGLLFSTKVEEVEEINTIARNIYERLVQSLAKDGPIDWSQVTRTGNIV